MTIELATPVGTIDVTVSAALRPIVLRLFGQFRPAVMPGARGPRAAVRAGSIEIVLTSGEGTARLAWRAGAGGAGAAARVRLIESRDAELVLEECVLDLIQAAAAGPSGGGWMVWHAAMVVTAGRAVLLVGPSGAGKSTLSLAWVGRPAGQPARLAADDMTLVRPAADGSEGRGRWVANGVARALTIDRPDPRTGVAGFDTLPAIAARWRSTYCDRRGASRSAYRLTLPSGVCAEGEHPVAAIVVLGPPLATDAAPAGLRAAPPARTVARGRVASSGFATPLALSVATRALLPHVACGPRQHARVFSAVAEVVRGVPVFRVPSGPGTDVGETLANLASISARGAGNATAAGGVVGQF